MGDTVTFRDGTSLQVAEIVLMSAQQAVFRTALGAMRKVGLEEIVSVE